MEKIAIRAPNPEIWPCLNYLDFEISMTTGRINQVSFCLFSKFVHGPAVDKFFTREMEKNAFRALLQTNPEIWPCLNYLDFEISI